MFAEQRMKIIKNLIRDEKQVTISRLCSVLNVSDVTVRKYLDILEKQHVLMKVHGGAVLAENTEETTTSVVPNRFDNIAKLAAQLINDRESIYIAPGPIGLQLAKNINSKQGISVITNNYNAVAELYQKVDSIHMIGGNIDVIDSVYYFSYPVDMSNELNEYAISQAFLDCNSFDLKAGFTIGSMKAAKVIHKCLTISDRINIMLPSAGFNKISLYKICSLADINSIITDASVSDELKEICYSKNIKLLISYNDLVV